MSLNFKALLFIFIGLFSGPLLAAEAVTNYIKEYEDIIKHTMGFLTAFVAVFGALAVAKLARKAPDAMVKLEQLKFIDMLILNKAWEEEHGKFIVEEAFKNYYQQYVPVDVIVLLAGLEKRFYAFSSYIKVGNLTSFNSDTNKIKSLNTVGKCLRFFSLLSFAILILFITAAIGTLSYSLLGHGDYSVINISFGVMCAFIFGIAFKLFLDVLDLMMGVFYEFSSFEKNLEGHIEKTEIRTFDISLLISTLIINALIGISIFFLFSSG